MQHQSFRKRFQCQTVLNMRMEYNSNSHQNPLRTFAASAWATRPLIGWSHADTLASAEHAPCYCALAQLLRAVHSARYAVLLQQVTRKCNHNQPSQHQCRLWPKGVAAPSLRPTSKWQT